jgi:single-strand DNA-binding protein
MNNITVVGHLCADPEERFIGDSGQRLVKFRVASNRIKKKDNDGSDAADFFNVVCWGKTAEFVFQYLKKGSHVYVAGTLSIREYTNRDGDRGVWIEIDATTVQSLQSRSDAERDSSKRSDSRDNDSRNNQLRGKQEESGGSRRGMESNQRGSGNSRSRDHRDFSDDSGADPFADE